MLFKNLLLITYKGMSTFSDEKFLSCQISSYWNMRTIDFANYRTWLLITKVKTIFVQKKIKDAAFYKTDFGQNAKYSYLILSFCI